MHTCGGGLREVDLELRLRVSSAESGGEQLRGIHGVKNEESFSQSLNTGRR